MKKNKFRVRFYKFYLPVIDVPEKTVIRKSTILPIIFWSVIMLFGFGGYGFYKSQILGEKIRFFGLALQSSIVFGYLIRALVLYFSPVLSLDSRGIKLSGKKKISWKNIENLRLKAVSKNEIRLTIIMKDGRKIFETFDNQSNNSRYWKQLFRSYFVKYSKL